MAPGKQIDFSKDVFPKLLQDNKPMYGYVADCYWCDIGDLRSYRQAQFDVLEGFGLMRFVRWRIVRK